MRYVIIVVLVFTIASVATSCGGSSPHPFDAIRLQIQNPTIFEVPIQKLRAGLPQFLNENRIKIDDVVGDSLSLKKIEVQSPSCRCDDDRHHNFGPRYAELFLAMDSISESRSSLAVTSRFWTHDRDAAPAANRVICESNGIIESNLLAELRIFMERPQQTNVDHEAR